MHMNTSYLCELRFHVCMFCCDSIHPCTTHIKQTRAHTHTHTHTPGRQPWPKPKPPLAAPRPSSWPPAALRAEVAPPPVPQSAPAPQARAHAHQDPHRHSDGPARRSVPTRVTHGKPRSEETGRIRNRQNRRTLQCSRLKNCIRMHVCDVRVSIYNVHVLARYSLRCDVSVRETKLSCLEPLKYSTCSAMASSWRR